MLNHDSIHFSNSLRVHLVRGNKRVDSVTLSNPFTSDLTSRLHDVGVLLYPVIHESDWRAKEDALGLFFTDVENLESCDIDIKDAHAFKVLKEIQQLDDLIDWELEGKAAQEDFNRAVARDAYFLREHGIYPDDV